MREADEETLETRLLADPSFVKEFDAVVEEITDQYIGGELPVGERELAEKYFLKAAERRKKVKFASALIDYASASRSDKVLEAPAPVPARQNLPLLERLLSFWNTQSFATRFATAMVTVAIVAGIAFLVFSGRTRSQTYTTVELAMSFTERGESPPTERVKLSPDADGLRIVLNLPDQLPSSQNYRVESVDEKGVKRNLEIVEQTPRTITAVAPASDLAPGRYGLHLSVLSQDGTVQRIPGTYRFSIE